MEVPRLGVALATLLSRSSRCAAPHCHPVRCLSVTAQGRALPRPPGLVVVKPVASAPGTLPAASAASRGPRAKSSEFPMAVTAVPGTLRERWPRTVSRLVPHHISM